jgi:hypothetical protein
VTDTRFRPRAYCDPSGCFGTKRPVTWRTEAKLSVAEVDQREAAKIQDKLARALRASLAADKVTVVEYADKVGIDPTRLGRILRGDVIIRLEEIVNTERNLRLMQRRRETEEGPGQG